MKTRPADHHPLASGDQAPGGRIVRNGGIMPIEEQRGEAETIGEKWGRERATATNAARDLAGRNADRAGDAGAIPKVRIRLIDRLG
jgi:hypothetical protein